MALMDDDDDFDGLPRFQLRTDQDIREAAERTVLMRGAAAEFYAAQRIRDFDRDEDTTQRDAWRRILKEIEALRG